MELYLLKDIVIILALSTLVNLLFTRMKIPTIVGYLMTGIIAGPHLLSVISGKHEIEILAEIGVVFLLFTIGIEFSLKHLLKIRRIVFLGGFIQVFATAGVFYLISKVYQLNWQSAVFIGFLIALSSSALVLKLLQERSELTSNYGRTILGILIFQDLLLVPLLLFGNLLGNSNLNIGNEILNLTLKAAGIIGFVYAGNKWILPRILHAIAKTKNQELFMMSIFLICLSIALFTSKMGMSLAFGAFLAGLMVSESEYSHNAFSNLIPFKDTFTSFFFVSIGLLLDLNFIINNYALVALTVALVIVFKALIAGGTGFILGHTFRGTVLVGLALSQVGEFSFILAKVGLKNNVIDNYYYQLFLAVAIISMGLTPFFMKGARPLVKLLLKLPLPKILVEGLFPLKETELPVLNNHLVIIGKDASALKLSKMAAIENISHASIIFDPLIAREKTQSGHHVVYGDAVNEPILQKAYAHKAGIIVVSVGNIIPAMAIVDKARTLNKNAYIIVRLKHIENMEPLYKLGADEVFPEKFEIAIDLFNRVLINKLYPQKQVNRILTHIRNINLGVFTEKDKKNQPSVFDELTHTKIKAIEVEHRSPVVGKTLLDIQLRSKTGATLLAVKRDKDIIEHPKPDIQFFEKDIVYLLGNPEQVNYAWELFNNEDD